MLSWVQENRAEYLETYSDIGEDLESVEDLEEDHKQFEANCVVSLTLVFSHFLVKLSDLSIESLGFPYACFY